MVADHQPCILRGFASHWPAVQSTKSGDSAIADYLRGFDNGASVEVMHGEPSIGGRFFYSDDMRGFNYRIEKMSIAQVIDAVMASAGRSDAPSLYAGAAATETHMPGFTAQNPLSIALPDAVPRIWVGGASKVSTHFDLSDNIAVVVSGRRRFTLFPPEQTRNLYVGPLNFTPAGQPVSMVDIRAPDTDRYPRFAEAWEAALGADLEPGDAIYIPSLWWHDIEALDPFNVLVNYWHGYPYDGSAFLAFLHAMMAVRDLPGPQKQAWAHWFDHFIFNEASAQAAAHLDEHAKGIQGVPSKGRTEALRQFILRGLGARG